MANPYFQFKQFTIYHDRCAMKVTTDACLFGAWCADEIQKEEIKSQKCLDIGTGTGLLPLMVLQKNNSLHFDAIEIDDVAAQQASENVSASAWKENVQVINADVKDHTNDFLYDIIISNPPFYENELSSENEKKNTAHHSSQLNLEQLVQHASRLSSPKAKLFLLLPYKRKEDILLLLSKYQWGIHQLVEVKQSVHHGFFRIIIAAEKNSSDDYFIQTFSICSEANQYSKEFTDLLKDYYLYL